MLRLELSGLRYQVIHALSTRNRQTEEYVAAAVDQAVASFDIRGEVERQVTIELKKSIERAVQHAIWDLFRDEGVKDAVYTAVRETLSLRPKQRRSIWQKLFRCRRDDQDGAQ